MAKSIRLIQTVRAHTILNILFMIFAPEQSYQLDYATCDYKEGVTGFSAKLLLSVRSWREKLRRCFICILSAFMCALVHQPYRLSNKYVI